MAGSWGYEAGHYEISQACGERALFPKVREAAEDTLVVADGFSCKTQIEQGVGRKALHVAQVLKLARGGDPWEQPRGPRRRLSNRLLLGGLGVAGAGAAAAWRRR
jgi:hypothetical protein